MRSILSNTISSVCAVVAYFLLGTAYSVAHAAECEVFATNPTGNVRIAKPTLAWRIILGKDTRIDNVILSLNGKLVDASYSTLKQSVIYQSQDPIPEGPYKVKCHIDFDDGTGMDKEWDFNVVKKAIVSLPPPDSAQVIVMKRVNAFREEVGYPDVVLNDALNAAATAHSVYLSDHNAQGHDESSQYADYTGSGPSERIASFGYTSSSYEDLCSGTETPATAVDRLFDAPYHRIPFLQPGQYDIGVGIMHDQTTLEFGASETDGVGNYPTMNQREVPTSWRDDETPDPLRMYGVTGVVGYPILFNYFSGVQSSIKVAKASLTTSNGAMVACYVNTPENDDRLPSGVLIIPKHPLKPDTEYTVIVDAQVVYGPDISKTWTFVTKADINGASRETTSKTVSWTK